MQVDKAVYYFCFTILNSLYELYKAAHRNFWNNLSILLLSSTSKVIKSKANYYTKDELDYLRRESDSLNAALTVLIFLIFKQKISRKFATFTIPGESSGKHLAPRRVPILDRSTPTTDDKATISKPKPVAPKKFVI